MVSSLALSSIVLPDSLSNSRAVAACAAPLQNGGFEISNRARGAYLLPTQETRYSSGTWIGEGRAGVDIKMNYAHQGNNNAWARNNSGWNGMRQQIDLDPNRVYTIEAYVRTSANLTDGYFGVRNATQTPYQEVKFGNLPNYTKLSVTFRTASQPQKYYVFAGLHALGSDTWIQVDNFKLIGTVSCNDVINEPS
jgi:hypothetical protein